MPVLSNDTLLTLAGYTPTRNGHDIAGTNAGNIYLYACWNWTLSGGRLAANDAESAPSIVDDLIVFDWQNLNGIYANGVNPAPVGYPGSAADFVILNAQLAAAQTARAGPHTPFTAPQAAFATALVRIMLRRNGLTPIAGAAAAQPYTVVMKSSDWWNTDHWAIGILVPPNNRRMYVQTVPTSPISHNCDRVWDEHLPHVTQGINGLLQVHIDVLNTVPKSPCRTCNQSHGALPSVYNRWHQCTRCGAIYCPNHGSNLAGKLGLTDPTRTCGVAACGGRTRLW